MRIALSAFVSRAFAFSFIAELTFVFLFVANYSQVFIASITSLNSVPIFGTIIDRVGAAGSSGSGQLQSLLGAFSPAVANAFTTALIWSVLNGTILVGYGISQYRN